MIVMAIIGLLIGVGGFAWNAVRVSGNEAAAGGLCTGPRKDRRAAPAV